MKIYEDFLKIDFNYTTYHISKLHNKFNNVIMYYLNTVNMVKSMYGIDHLIIGTSYHNIGNTYHRSHNFDKAM